MRLLEELSLTNLRPITLHCDNQSTIYIANNPVFHDRTKHIEVDCHLTRDKVLEGLIQLSYFPTTHQLADMLTKILPSPHFSTLLRKLGMVKSPSSLRGDDKSINTTGLSMSSSWSQRMSTGIIKGLSSKHLHTWPRIKGLTTSPSHKQGYNPEMRSTWPTSSIDVFCYRKIS